MEIKSSAFTHEGQIPSIYTCEGKNINPPLTFHNIPKNTVTFVLIMEDSDVPLSIRADGMWDHWILFNIPSSTLAINTQSPGTLGKNTSGHNSYDGPCPPDGEHRYFFHLFSLDCRLNLPEGSSKKDIQTAMNGHILEHATLIGKYKKKKPYINHPTP